MGVCQGAPLLKEGTGLLHNWGGLTQQHRVARQPKNKIDVAPLREHLYDLWGGEMTVSPDEDMGLRPMAAQIGQEPDQDHGVLRTRGALARAETGGD